MFRNATPCPVREAPPFAAAASTSTGSHSWQVCPYLHALLLQRPLVGSKSFCSILQCAHFTLSGDTCTMCWHELQNTTWLLSNTGASPNARDVVGAEQGEAAPSPSAGRLLLADESPTELVLSSLTRVQVMSQVSSAAQQPHTRLMGCTCPLQMVTVPLEASDALLLLRVSCVSLVLVRGVRLAVGGLRPK